MGLTTDALADLGSTSLVCTVMTEVGAVATSAHELAVMVTVAAGAAPPGAVVNMAPPGMVRPGVAPDGVSASPVPDGGRDYPRVRIVVCHTPLVPRVRMSSRAHAMDPAHGHQ